MIFGKYSNDVISICFSYKNEELIVVTSGTVDKVGIIQGVP